MITKVFQATHTFSKLLRAGVGAMHIIRTHVPSMVQGVAEHPALHFTLCGLLMLALVSLAVSQCELYMTGAGIFLIAIGIVSAVQEFALSQTASFFGAKMDRGTTDTVTLPHLAPVASSAITIKQQVNGTNVKTVSRTLHVASSSSVNVTTPPVVAASSSMQVKISRPKSDPSAGALEAAVPPTAVAQAMSSSNPIGSKLDVRHCGTVIDIQGTHGFIIRHDVGVDATTGYKGLYRHAVRQTRSKAPYKMPLVIPFYLNEKEAAVCREIAVGKTVEFACAASVSTSTSTATLRALNVTVVSTADGYVTSRSLLQSCKQVRKVSFARAMEELTMIAPRHEPVKHHVDLIKYAEQLDDCDTPLDQCIY